MQRLHEIDVGLARATITTAAATTTTRTLKVLHEIVHVGLARLLLLLKELLRGERVRHFFNLLHRVERKTEEEFEALGKLLGMAKHDVVGRLATVVHDALTVRKTFIQDDLTVTKVTRKGHVALFEIVVQHEEQRMRVDLLHFNAERLGHQTQRRLRRFQVDDDAPRLT